MHRLLALSLCAAALAPPLAAADPEAWRTPLPEQPAHVLVQGATVWTSGPDGVLADTDLLVTRGKVAAVGRGLAAPAGAVVIDGRGKHVTPGIIDAHSHAAIVGDVNESTNSVTAEVRIADVIDAESIDVYRQLAGGVTTINLLHGSANAIGGQNAVIKLRWGATPEELRFAAAPPGIKFALGENPKQANGTVPAKDRRYPQTRQGVEQVIRERFLAARDYAAEQGAPVAPGQVPPRPDLQLAAIAEILAGERQVHAHSYRADEILMLLRIAEEFGFEVAAFQHVLEGYKVADELAAQRAGASTFSDWWGYKYEVIDAIPYNGAIMWERGVVVSYNSDSAELARHLNLEAAKAVRYGGVPEAEALKLVTLNPAIQLGVADRVGSLEVGKDGDFAVWNGHPLSTYTLCEQTWVDGRKHFDRAADLAARDGLAAERQALLAEAQAAAKQAAAQQKADAAAGGEKPAAEAPPAPPDKAPEKPPETPSEKPAPAPTPAEPPAEEPAETPPDKAPEKPPETPVETPPPPPEQSKADAPPPPLAAAAERRSR